MARILIVEDEPEMARGLKDILEFEGHEAVVAVTGKEGLAAVGRRDVDCIILDLMLPDINGYQVCQALRECPASALLPIIMVTASEAATTKPCARFAPFASCLERITFFFIVGSGFCCENLLAISLCLFSVMCCLDCLQSVE